MSVKLLKRLFCHIIFLDKDPFYFTVIFENRIQVPFVKSFEFICYLITVFISLAFFLTLLLSVFDVKHCLTSYVT